MYTNITMTCFYHANCIACLCYIPINHAWVYRFFILRLFLLSSRKKILQNALHKVLWKETYRVFYTIIYVYIYKSVYIYDDAVCNWQSRILYWFIYCKINEYLKFKYIYVFLTSRSQCSILTLKFLVSYFNLLLCRTHSILRNEITIIKYVDVFTYYVRTALLFYYRNNLNNTQYTYPIIYWNINITINVNIILIPQYLMCYFSLFAFKINIF